MFNHPTNRQSRRSFLRQFASGSITLGAGAASLPSILQAHGTPAIAQRSARTYTNPVYAASMPDPFVLRHAGIYYAFGTTGRGRKPDGRIFTLLRSTNLVDWQEIGGALIAPADSEGRDFWAPEVVQHNGTFFMYYSMGGSSLNVTQGHKLRVATSTRPEGPYRDLGVQLADPNSPFTIDAHPFKDTDEQWYLFYARDFLDSEGGVYPGTAVVVDRLIDMTKLAGESRVVLRARYPWTLFQANRRMPLYDNRVFAQWHTIEGPFVRKHNNRYYCFYSGSNYTTTNYGVDYGVADNIMGPYSDRGAENGARVLHSVPGHVRGPGHHSIITGSDGKTDYIVYHAWDAGMKERQMWIDKLVWTKDGPRRDGPTHRPQPRPKS